MLQYEDDFDPFAPGADPNAPGMYAPPGVGGAAPPSGRVPTQNDPDWTPPGPGWTYVDGAGWRFTGGQAGPPATGGGGGGSPEDDAARGLVGGYYGANGQWVRGEPRSGGGGGGSDQGGGEMPQWASPDYPGYKSAGPFTPRNATFSFDAFKPSSWGDAENEPGYAASRQQLRQQVEAGAAHRGILRSGMALGDIYTNLDALSQQNFAQFDDRNFRNWSGNLSASRNKFLDEYGIDKDQYSFKATDVDRENNYGFNVADARARDSLQRWQEQVRSLTQLGRPV